MCFEPTTPHREQPAHIALDLPVRPDPVLHTTGELSLEVQTTLEHRKRGCEYQWLALMEGSPQLEAKWQATRGFLDSNETLTEAFHSYIVKKNILTHLHLHGRQQHGARNGATKMMRMNMLTVTS